MNNLPDPLTTPDCDLHEFRKFMLDVDRLLSSELAALATGEEFKAAVLLWCRAWKQVPCGSLPDDDRVLSAFSGAGARWAKVKEMALRGFVKCSDGRLYHKVLCAEAREAHGRKIAAAQEREADRKRKSEWRDRKKDMSGGRPPDTNRTSGGTNDGTEHGSPPQSPLYDIDRTGTGQDIESINSTSLRSVDAPDPTPDRIEQARLAIWSDGLAWIAAKTGKPPEKIRSLLGKWRKIYGDVALLEAIGRARGELPSDPIAWLDKALQGRARGPTHGQKLTEYGHKQESIKRVIDRMVGHGEAGVDSLASEAGDRANAGALPGPGDRDERGRSGDLLAIPF